MGHAWYFYGILAHGKNGSRLHYVVANRVTGEELNTYRQIKKARQLVRELNK